MIFFKEQKVPTELNYYWIILILRSRGFYFSLQVGHFFHWLAVRIIWCVYAFGLHPAPALCVRAATFFKISPSSLDEFQVVLWLSENNMWICSIYYQSTGCQWHRWSTCNRMQSCVAEKTSNASKAWLHFYRHKTANQSFLCHDGKFHPTHFPFSFLRKFCLDAPGRI